MKRFVFILTILLGFGNAQGQAPSHDPTKMVKDGGKYWIFTTGNGIWHMSSSDKEFNNWQSEGEIFGGNTWPSWIDSYVPDFGGHFWAPGVIYMNNKWHVYYSCSSFGSQTSAIGVVTSPSLTNPSWQDQGMVVYSNGSRGSELGYQINAIDADVFKDKEGRFWLLYGSYWNGLVVTELDSVTGKPFDDTKLSHVANGNPEAGAIIEHEGLYYIFFNRGSCCRGINSSYRVLMGRSKKPNGPFYDQDSTMTHQGGGTLFLHTDGKYIGPGHFGLGEDKLTYHYYDGANNGSPRLKVADLNWGDDGWPTATYERNNGTLPDSVYAITNRNSDMTLQVASGYVKDGTNAIQGAKADNALENWRFTHVGDGYYEISPVLGTSQSLEIAGCSNSNRANIQLGDSTGTDCQLWFLGRMGNYYRIESKSSIKTLEIEGGSMDEGGNAVQWAFNEHPRQQWGLSYRSNEDTEIPAILSSSLKSDFLAYQNSSGTITIGLGDYSNNQSIVLSIYQLNGTRIFEQQRSSNDIQEVPLLLKPGLYLVKVASNNLNRIQKLIIR